MIRKSALVVPSVVTLLALSWLVPQAAGQTVAPRAEGVHIDGKYGYWLPPDVSSHGWEIDQLINVIHWFMGVLFVGWGIFFVYCLVRFRRRPGHQAVYEPIKAKASKFGEIAVAAFEAVLLLGFSVPIWASVKNRLPEAGADPLEVYVIAEQFAWNFHYPGADGKFGRFAPRLVDTAANPAGLDRGDPYGTDDIVSGEFHIPTGRPVICHIRSKDVIHSFAIPVMRVKQDAIPGMIIPIWFQARETGVEGTYEVACAQLCGNNHYSMRALMVVEAPEKFAAWLKVKSAPAEEFDPDALD